MVKFVRACDVMFIKLILNYEKKKNPNAIQNFFILFLSDYIILLVHQHGEKHTKCVKYGKKKSINIFNSIFTEHDSNTL